MNSHPYRSVEWKMELAKKMMTIRMFEQELHRQHDAKNIRGTVHICVGQEAVAVGCCESLRKGDVVTSTHRGHGHFIARGGSLDSIMAELFGRRTGYCRGKGGTQHMASHDDGFLGSNGITGGGIPYATGIALALHMRDTGNIALCFFGDGASNQGTFHESLNMAAIWKLPILYVCENNQYAMSSKMSDMAGVDHIADRAAAYGIPGVLVDGNDVLAVAQATREALATVRSGDGPVLLEAKTYRACGHSRSDQCRYRTREEEKSWALRCPIRRLQQVLLSEGVVDHDALRSWERCIQREIENAVNYAAGSGSLTREELLEGVFSSTGEDGI